MPPLDLYGEFVARFQVTVVGVPSVPSGFCGVNVNEIFSNCKLIDSVGSPPADEETE